MRAFIAVTLSEDARTLLDDVCQLLRRDAPRWRSEKWVPTINLHFTLRFLGTVSDASVGAIVERTRIAVRGMRPFTWRLDGVRAVPHRRGARMLWAVPASEDAGLELAARLTRVGEELSGSSSLPEDVQRSGGPGREFAPHVTLCRARQSRVVPVEALKRANDVVTEARCSMSVEAVTLFASELTRSGPRYAEVAVVRFEND